MKEKRSLVYVLRVAVILTLLSPGVNSRAQADPAPAADVPVRQVVLFSSGVGYFQHEGTVSGDGTARLQFKTAQLNDILKSLVLQDLNGGHVGVVTYPSQDPLEKTLASFQVDLGDNPGMGDLLNKLRGARVTVRSGSESLAGTVLGVEKRQVPGAKEGNAPVEKAFLNLVTDKGLMSLDLGEVYAIKLEDAGLQDELNRALAAVAGARDQDKKPVEIHFNGTGERRVRLGYVVETPVWKASYRLVLPDSKEKDAKDAKGTLQGWAMVDNPTDNDWNDVGLSLVSGRPISFQQDLYGPLYVPRPTVVPEQYASLKPQEYEGGQKHQPESMRESLVEDDKTSAPVFPAFRNAPVAKAGAQTRDKVIRRLTSEDDASGKIADNISESVLPTTDTAKVGELFQYTIGHVSLARQQSAMIPIINDPVPMEKLSIYNESVLATHPLNGVRLHNDTPDKKHLLQGPVTVFDEGRYAGDARLDDVPPGQTRLLSYGIDLQTLVNVKNLDAQSESEQQQVIQTGKIVGGVLQITRKRVSAKEYSTENKSDHDKTLIIEHPVREGWKLVDMPAAAETTDKLYRFQRALGVGRTDRFTVKEELVFMQGIELLSGQLEDMQFYSKAGAIPAPVREALVKVMMLKQAAADSQRRISDHDAQIKAIDTDQNRIRKNLETVGKTGDFAARQLKKLDDQESQIDRLHTETDALRTRLDEQQKELANYLNGLNVG